MVDELGDTRSDTPPQAGVRRARCRYHPASLRHAMQQRPYSVFGRCCEHRSERLGGLVQITSQNMRFDHLDPCHTFAAGVLSTD